MKSLSNRLSSGWHAVEERTSELEVKSVEITYTEAQEKNGLKRKMNKVTMFCGTGSRSLTLVYLQVQKERGEGSRQKIMEETMTKNFYIC